MTFGGCPREKEVAELLHRGHWPQACTRELRTHVDGCRACADLILVTQTFQRDRAIAASMPRLESAGVLWWRAQLRRRNTAIERIGKPIFGAQVFALAISALVALVLLASQAKQGFRWIAWLQEFPHALHLEALWPTTIPKLNGSVLFLVPVLATIAIVSGVVYMASEKQ
jgi:hypothetical protein